MPVKDTSSRRASGPRGRVVKNTENARARRQGVVQNAALASAEHAHGIDPLRRGIIDDGRHGRSQLRDSCGDLVVLVTDFVVNGSRQPDVSGIAEKVEVFQRARTMSGLVFGQTITPVRRDGKTPRRGRPSDAAGCASDRTSRGTRVG